MPEDRKSVWQKVGMLQPSSGSGDVAASQTNSLPSRVVWAASGAGSAPRHPALRTALPPLQYRLHVRHIASGCSHRGLSHRIALHPIASRSGCRAALPPAADSTGGLPGQGAHARRLEPPTQPRQALLPPDRDVLSRGREVVTPSLPPAPQEDRHRGWQAGEWACTQGWTPSQAQEPHWVCGAGLPLASIAGSRVLT